MQLGNYTNAKLDENMIRHMVLNSLRSIKQKWSAEYGEIVIACDNGKIWRKKIFPYYKANRKINNDKSDIDWSAIYSCLLLIRNELKEFSPYKIIDVDYAEADDIIGTLVKSFPERKILILSGDKDFIQLHVNPNVKQYDSIRTKWITHDDPANFLKEHIFNGDRGDGVPNILSPDNCFVEGQRQGTMSKKRLDYFKNTDPSEYKTNEARNYDRNKQIIDLDYTPKEIREEILKQYEEQTDRSRKNLLPYFMKHKLKNLIPLIPEF